MRVIGWIRRDHGAAPDIALLALALVLVRLPVALGSPYAWPLRLLVLMPFLLSIARNLLRIARGSVARVHGTLMLLLACYVGVVSVSYLRALTDGRLTLAIMANDWPVFLTVAIAGVLAFAATSSSNQQNQLRLAILGGLVVYLAANLALYVTGVSHPEIVYRKEFPASMLELLGIRVSAALFPMAGGVNAFGAIGGAALAMSGAVLVKGARTRATVLLALAGLTLGLITLVWTDGRLSLVASLLTVAMVAAVRERGTPALRWVILVPLLFPPILLGFLSTVPASWWEVAGDSARQIASLSNRESIWRVVFAELQAFRPVHLVGFGAYGQLTSGLSAAYSQYFSAYILADFASAHNAFLQSVVETGYIGAGVVMAALALAFRHLADTGGIGLRHVGSGVLVGFLAFLALIGAVESSWSPEQQELQVVLLLSLAAAAVSPRQADPA